MTGIEKGVITAIIVCSVIFILSVGSCVHELNKAGGIKGLIIETGKEIKDIKKQIDKE